MYVEKLIVNIFSFLPLWLHAWCWLFQTDLISFTTRAIHSLNLRLLEILLCIYFHNHSAHSQFALNQPKCLSLIPPIQTGDYIWSWLLHVKNKMKLLKWIINILDTIFSWGRKKRHFQSASNIDAIYELCNFRIFMPSAVLLTCTTLHDPLFWENQYRAERTEQIAMQMFIAECSIAAAPVRKVYWRVEWITKKP